MAQTFSHGFTPAEVAFMCEMEEITIVPRQRLESIPLLSGATPPLRPPHRASVPLWLALLLKRQRRADIVAPAWLDATRLTQALERETADTLAFTEAPDLAPPKALTSTEGDMITSTPPFDGTSTADYANRLHTDAVRNGASTEEEEAAKSRLPFHWLDMSQLLLADAASDIPDAENIRRLLRDLREVRMAKVRNRVAQVDGITGVNISGIGAMELCESRGFMSGVVDGLRKIGKSREDAARERAEEEGAEAGDEGQDGGDSDEDMVM